MKCIGIAENLITNFDFSVDCCMSNTTGATSGVEMFTIPDHP